MPIMLFFIYPAAILQACFMPADAGTRCTAPRGRGRQAGRLTPRRHP